MNRERRRIIVYLVVLGVLLVVLVWAIARCSC